MVLTFILACILTYLQWRKMNSFSKYTFFFRVNITTQRKTTKNDQLKFDYFQLQGTIMYGNNHGFLCLNSFDGTEEVSRY